MKSYYTITHKKLKKGNQLQFLKTNKIFQFSHYQGIGFYGKFVGENSITFFENNWIEYMLNNNNVKLIK